MFVKEKEVWRDGVFLCHTKSSLDADILESKLRSEGIPCVKKYQGASNFIEIAMGSNTSFPIDIYVPADRLEDAKIDTTVLGSDHCPVELTIRDEDV